MNRKLFSNKNSTEDKHRTMKSPYHLSHQRRLTKHVVALLLFICGTMQAQDSTSALQALSAAFPQRPVGSDVGLHTSLGGYTDANVGWIRNDGADEGMSFELRHFNLFVYSSISARMSMMAEIEFEHGTEEISLESATMDFRLRSDLRLRAGVLLAPLGYFNTHHDSPLYEFIDRPIVATQLLPGTLSLPGVGLSGVQTLGSEFRLSAEAYVCNGLGDGILDIENGRTHIGAAKNNELFEESNNGVPAYVGRLALRWKRSAELGLSAYHGVYNSFRIEGIDVDTKRSLSMAALDYQWQIADDTRFMGESALITLQLPQGLESVYAAKQWGSYAELTQTLCRFAALDYNEMVLNVSLRAEYVDYNWGQFADGSSIADDESALSLALAIRPTASTSMRCVYQYHRVFDRLNNLSVVTGLQWGIASYF